MEMKSKQYWEKVKARRMVLASILHKVGLAPIFSDQWGWFAVISIVENGMMCVYNTKLDRSYRELQHHISGGKLVGVIKLSIIRKGLK